MAAEALLRHKRKNSRPLRERPDVDHPQKEEAFTAVIEGQKK
jgi:hypothetical protein